MHTKESFPPNSDSEYVARLPEKDEKASTLVSGQYVPGVGFATVIESNGRLLEAVYPITSGDSIREITREDFESRYQQPIDPLHPKFGFMQRIREEITGIVSIVLGCPSDNYVLGETLEPAYIITEAPGSAWGDIQMHPKKIITQKKIERVGAYTLVEERVGKGSNPAIEYKQSFPLGVNNPTETVDFLQNAGSLNRQQPTSTGEAQPVKARGMNSAIFHIDDLGFAPAQGITPPRTDPDAYMRGHTPIAGILQPIVADDQASY